MSEANAEPLSGLEGWSRKRREPIPALGELLRPADPFPAYARLRAEAPVQRVRAPFGSYSGDTVYLVTRYGDVNRVLREPETFTSDKTSLAGHPIAWVPSFVRTLQNSML